MEKLVIFFIKYSYFWNLQTIRTFKKNINIYVRLVCCKLFSKGMQVGAMKNIFLIKRIFKTMKLSSLNQK